FFFFFSGHRVSLPDILLTKSLNIHEIIKGHKRLKK
ncbi:unnamed protein product, partial [Prunus brigantina]